MTNVAELQTRLSDDISELVGRHAPGLKNALEAEGCETAKDFVDVITTVLVLEVLQTFVELLPDEVEPIRATAAFMNHISLASGEVATEVFLPSDDLETVLQ